MNLDKFDLAILKVLQENARASLNDIGAAVGLSSTPCWNRIKRMESAGVIRGYRAVVDPQAAGAAISALVSVAVLDHARSQVTDLVPLMRALPGVQQVFLLGGDRDLVIHVAVADVPALREFIRVNIGAHPDLCLLYTSPSPRDS